MRNASFKSKIYTKTRSASQVEKAGLALLMALVTAIAAQIAIPLPGTPVPITGQTFAVLMAGVLLGRNWGGVSQIFYLVIGSLGLPWFASASGGALHLWGPTGGYLIGFVLAAFFIGYQIERLKQSGFFTFIGVFWFASFVLIQVPGLTGLALWMSWVQQEPVTLMQTLNMGFLPFVPGDILKILMAAICAKAFLPK